MTQPDAEPPTEPDTATAETVDALPAQTESDGEEFVPSKRLKPVTDNPGSVDDGQIIAYWDEDNQRTLWADGTPLSDEQEQVLEDWQNGVGEHANSDTPPYEQAKAIVPQVKPARVKSDPEAVAAKKKAAEKDAADKKKESDKALAEYADTAPDLLQQLYGDDTTADRSPESKAFLSKAAAHLKSLQNSKVQQLARNFVANPKGASGTLPDGVDEQDMRSLFITALADKGVEGSTVKGLLTPTAEPAPEAAPEAAPAATEVSGTKPVKAGMLNDVVVGGRTIILTDPDTLAPHWPDGTPLTADQTTAYNGWLDGTGDLADTPIKQIGETLKTIGTQKESTK